MHYPQVNIFQICFLLYHILQAYVQIHICWALLVKFHALSKLGSKKWKADIFMVVFMCVGTLVW